MLLRHKAGQEGRGEILLENSLGDVDATREKQCTQLVITFQYFMY